MSCGVPDWVSIAPKAAPPKVTAGGAKPDTPRKAGGLMIGGGCYSSTVQPLRVSLVEPVAYFRGSQNALA
jgi:hypothetical protein